MVAVVGLGSMTLCARPATADPRASAPSAAVAPIPGLPQPPVGAPTPPAVAAGAASPEVVVGSESRQPVPHPRSYPHGAIGSLTLTWPGPHSVRCTGTFVGPRSVLTAAHCLWKPRWGGKPSSIVFRPGETLTVDGLIVCEVRKPANMRVMDSYVASPGEETDVAVIKTPRCHYPGLSGNVDASKTGWLGFLQNNLTGRTVQLAGYPEFVDDERHGSEMCAEEGAILDTDPRLIWYRMDATEGQSGAPVFD